jgi:WD40 repeat protein
MVFSTDGTTFGVHAYDRSGCVAKIETWKLGDGEAFATPLRRRNVEAARIISFSPRLDAFATATDRGDRTGPQEVQVRDMTTGTVLAQARYEDTETDISVLSFSNDGHFLIARAGRGNQDSQKSKIAVWDVRSGLANARTFLDESQHGTVSPDGKGLAQPNENGVEVVGTITGAGGGTFTRSGDYDFCWKSFYKTSRGSSGRAVFAPDSSSVVVSGYINMGRPSLLDKWVPARFNLLRGKGFTGARLWAVDTGQELAIFERCQNALFSADGRLLATRHDSDIRIWNLPIRKPLTPILFALMLWLALLACFRIIRWWIASPRANSAGPS